MNTGCSAGLPREGRHNYSTDLHRLMLTKTKREKEAAMSKEIQTEKEAATSTIGLFTRQPLSPLGKIAFSGFLVATIGSVGGDVAIAIGSGNPSLDIVKFGSMRL